MSETASFRIAIAGLGTVGCGVIEIIQKYVKSLSVKCGKTIEIVGVSARTKVKKRSVSIESYEWKDTAQELLSIPDLDAVIELIGGEDGTALELAKGALEKGISFVTANKAMLAHHGVKLSKIAEENNCNLLYEAAVAGGIPVIKAIKEGLAANEIKTVSGILNGTCNYILTQMLKTGQDFDSILKIAQELGYAEADPSFDIDGIDTAHKVHILAMLSFGVSFPFSDISTQGIRDVTLPVILLADRAGFRIKLLGQATLSNESVSCSVEPCLVKTGEGLGGVHDVFNAVEVNSDSVGKSVFIGRGAGGGPTASAVVADILDLALGRAGNAFGKPVSELSGVKCSSESGNSSSWFIVLDGRSDEHKKTFETEDIQIHSQSEEAIDGKNYFVFITKPCSKNLIDDLLGKIHSENPQCEKPMAYRIHDAL